MIGCQRPVDQGDRSKGCEIEESIFFTAPFFQYSQLLLQFFHILFRQERTDHIQIIVRFLFSARLVAGLGSAGGQPEHFRIGAQGDVFLLGEGGEFFPGGRRQFISQLLGDGFQLALYGPFLPVVQAQQEGVPGTLPVALVEQPFPFVPVAPGQVAGRKACRKASRFTRPKPSQSFSSRSTDR